MKIASSGKPMLPISILVVDDDQDDYIMLRDLLGEIPEGNFILEWASSYELGRIAIEKKSHDVYFLDFRLGAQTGLDLLKMAIERGCRAPMILLTGYGEHEVDLEAMRIGASDYLVKDEISAALLEKSIRYSIHRNQMEAEILMQDRLASIGLLASSLAHEIGTPLGVIRGRAEYLGIQIHDSSPVRKSLDVIISQIDRVSKLIRSLLNLARGDQMQPTGAILLNQVVEEVIELMAHELRKNSIEIKNLLVQEIPILIQAQSQPLHQVILNLLVNAVHAIEAAIKERRHQNHFIQFSAEELPSQWMIFVQDTGCGISEMNLRNIFKPFFTTKDIGVGTGLGLATSYRIVESWGGEIQVESKEGVGTVFKIHLPKPQKQ